MLLQIAFQHAFIDYFGLNSRQLAQVFGRLIREPGRSSAKSEVDDGRLLTHDLLLVLVNGFPFFVGGSQLIGVLLFRWRLRCCHFVHRMFHMRFCVGWLRQGYRMPTQKHTNCFAESDFGIAWRSRLSLVSVHRGVLGAVNFSIQSRSQADFVHDVFQLDSVGLQCSVLTLHYRLQPLDLAVELELLHEQLVLQ